MTQELSVQFNSLATEWSEHCRNVSFSSNIDRYLDAPSYRGLVALGRPAIPLIMKRYEADDLPWGFVLDEITGLKMIGDRRRFNPKEVKRLWFEWWSTQTIQDKQKR